jgi:RNA polymerase sigma factor (sigma-70 family)
MTPDSELLRQFARTNSQDAFAELVKRHVNLVYSAALRQMNGDGHLAKDVSQTVFTDLARKADSLSRRESLTGWLYTSAHFAASKIVRGENRRRGREEKFMREPIHESGAGFQPVESASQIDWEKLRPTLDDAMHELKETDREAVLLRYFESRQFAEVGAKLGINENAARMRVERALEKLRDIFTKRGVTTATALASVISANAIQLAPANLAATLTTASIATAGTGTFTLLKIMTATKLKFAFSALVVAGVATAFVHQQQLQNKLREENESLTQQIAQLQTDNESLSNRLEEVGDSKKLTNEQFSELLKLRGEVTLLRREKKNLPETAQSKTSNLPVKKIQIHLRTKFVSLPTEDLPILGVGWTTDSQGGKIGLLTEQQLKNIDEALQGASDVSVISAPQVITINGERATMSVTRKVGVLDLNEDGTLHSTNVTYVDTGTLFEVTPYFLTNSSTFDLNLNAKLIQLAGDSSQTNLQTTEVTNHVSLQPGQTVVLEKEIHPDKFSESSTNATADPRSLLMFVTPTVVKANDYQPNGRVAGIVEPPDNTDATDYFPKSPPQLPPANQNQ